MRVQSIKSCLIASVTMCLISTLLIGLASLTPGWRSINGKIRLHDRTSRSFSISTGLFGFLCSTVTDQTAKVEDFCLDWANSVSFFERFVSVLCIISALVGVIALFWSLIILLDLFPDWENKPRWALPALAFITFILAIVAATVYFFWGCSENDNFVVHWTSSPSSSSPSGKCSLNYSFFIFLAGCFAALFGFVAALMVMLLKKSLASANPLSMLFLASALESAPSNSLWNRQIPSPHFLWHWQQISKGFFTANRQFASEAMRCFGRFCKRSKTDLFTFWHCSPDCVEWTLPGGAGPGGSCEEVDHNPPTLDELSRVIYSILMPFVCLLGSVGALISLSSFDFVLLVCAVIIYPSMNLCLQDGNRGLVCHFFWRTSLATYPVSLMAQTASVWTVVAITIDRYLAVKYPLHMRAWCTAHRAQTVVLSITAVAALFKMPSFFEVALNDCGRLTKTELRQDHLYFIIYYTYGYLLLMLAAPFLFIIVLNAQILSIIRKANVQRCEMRVIRKRTNHSSGIGIVVDGGGRDSFGNGTVQPNQPPQKGDQLKGTSQLTTNSTLNAFFYQQESASSVTTALDSRCTKMAVVTISAFVSFNWLAGINHVIEAFDLVRDDGRNMRIPIGNFLVCLNSATNIFIYSLFGRRFRHQFCRIFCHCSTRKYDQMNRSICPQNKTDPV
uniref:G-protein coupled receptors family 1 profile domain-containing protein n=1 Tax=Globodera rostochiensis TaxID=31243 RepID=A0A914HHZ5_GLORO